MLSTPRAIFTVGAPRSGKSTGARNFAISNAETALVSLDDFRATFCGSKQRYHQMVAEAGFNHPMRWAVHEAHVNCLDYFLSRGTNVVMHNTHVKPQSFEREWHVCRRHSIVPELVVFERPLELLLQRNAASFVDDRVPDKVIQSMHEELFAPDAWWRSRKHILA